MSVALDPGLYIFSRLSSDYARKCSLLKRFYVFSEHSVHISADLNPLRKTNEQNNNNKTNTINTRYLIWCLNI